VEEEGKKKKEKEDKEWRDKVWVEAEAELARAAKELEDEMVESERTGDADVTPRVWHDLFGDLEGDKEEEEVMELEPDKTSKGMWEKEWVISHKEMKSAEIHLTTAHNNLTTAMYSQRTFPGAEMDAQLAEWRKELAEWRKELREAVVHVRSAWAKDVMLTILVIARWKDAAEKDAAEQQDKEEG
jgi:hypothetical protein